MDGLSGSSKLEPAAPACVPLSILPEAMDQSSMSPSTEPATGRTGTRQDTLISMLRAPEGATIEEIVVATGGLSHTMGEIRPGR